MTVPVGVMMRLIVKLFKGIAMMVFVDSNGALKRSFFALLPVKKYAVYAYANGRFWVYEDGFYWLRTVIQVRLVNGHWMASDKDNDKEN